MNKKDSSDEMPSLAARSSGSPLPVRHLAEVVPSPTSATSAVTFGTFAQTPRARHALRRWWLNVFAAAGNYQAAAKYLPKAGTEQIGELYASMMVYLHEGDAGGAQRISRKCLRAYKSAARGPILSEGLFVQERLHMALAAFYHLTGEPVSARKFWGMAMDMESELPDAIEGTALSHLESALSAVTAGLRELGVPSEGDDFLSLQSAGLIHIGDRISSLHRLRTGLLRLLSEEIDTSCDQRRQSSRDS